MSKDTQYAFPVPVASMGTPSNIKGMTLHQYYVGKALVGILSAGIGVSGNDNGHHHEPELIANACIKYADAMIKEGNK